MVGIRVRPLGDGRASEVCCVWCGVVRCSVLQCVAVCCSVLQCAAGVHIRVRPVCDGRAMEVRVCVVMQCAAVFCSMLQRVEMCCSVLQCFTVRYGYSYKGATFGRWQGDGGVCVWCDAVCCSVLQCAAVCCRVLQCVAVCCSVLQCVACIRIRMGPLCDGRAIQVCVCGVVCVCVV